MHKEQTVRLEGSQTFKSSIHLPSVALTLQAEFKVKITAHRLIKDIVCIEFYHNPSTHNGVTART